MQIHCTICHLLPSALCTPLVWWWGCALLRVRAPDSPCPRASSPTPPPGQSEAAQLYFKSKSPLVRKKQGRKMISGWVWGGRRAWSSLPSPGDSGMGGTERRGWSPWAHPAPQPHPGQQALSSAAHDAAEGTGLQALYFFSETE